MTKIVKKKSEELSSKQAKTSKIQNMNVKGSIKKLLVSPHETIEDKIATVKTAQMVDKERFENAFKTLMKR